MVVARGWAGWAMAYPFFMGFKDKNCKMIHLRHTFCFLAHPVSECYLQLWEVFARLTKEKEKFIARVSDTMPILSVKLSPWE